MKFYLIALAIVFGMSCNDSSSTSNNVAPSSNINLDGFEQIDIGNGIIKVDKKDSGGVLLESGYLFKGMKHGAWTIHYPENGRVKSMMNYVNGDKNGVYLEFNNRGQIETKFTYANDLLNGRAGTYKFGRTEMSCNYKDGQFDGDYKEYFKSGQEAGNVNKLIQYKNGIQHGRLIYYNIDESIMLEYLYDNGKKISGGDLNK